MLFFALPGFAQPLFKVPKPTCSSVQLTELTPNIYQSYHWDFGNGVTADTYTPPVVQYATTGNKTISLTVTSTTPFRVIDTIIVTQHHASSWIGTGFCLNENLPDLFLEYIPYTTFSPVWARTPIHDEALLPVVFPAIGIPVKTSFPVTLWDKDDGFWCGASDFLGQITVPANTIGGVFNEPSYPLSLTIKTKLVNTLTYSQTFTLDDAPATPTIICQDDTLVTNYTAAVQWLDVNLNPIAGAFGQKFHPAAAGKYSVRYIGGVCPVISTAFQYNPGCIVAAAAPEPADTTLLVYPNPSTGGPVYVRLPRTILTAVHCRVTDTKGTNSRDITWFPAGNGDLQLDLTDYPSGIYVLTVTTKNAVFTQKITLLPRP